MKIYQMLKGKDIYLFFYFIVMLFLYYSEEDEPSWIQWFCSLKVSFSLFMYYYRIIIILLFLKGQRIFL